jgi:hypothetical protein
MTTYFLSYARLDERTALRFAGDLIAAGVSVWVDQYDIRPSQHWDRAVETAVRGCQGMIVILSPRSAASPNVADEVSVALEDGKDLIPVLIEPCVMPLRMTRMQYIDAHKDYDGAVRRCLEVIGAGVEMRPGPTGETATLAAEVLRDAERRLTSFMGPIAGVLVRQAAASAAGEAALYQALASSIANPADRESFLGWITEARPVGQVVTPRATKTPEGPPAPSIIATDDLKTITGALIRHIGPIAAQLVKRGSADAASREELCRRLAARIAGEKDRAAFLKDVQRV